MATEWGAGLPSPYYQDDACTIFHGDCRGILPGLSKVDLVLTDPPYGIGDRWQGGTWGANPMYSTDARRWDKAPDGETIQAVLYSGGEAILWGGNHFAYMLPPSRCWLCWWKNSQMPTLADFELAWTSYDRPCKGWSENRNNQGTKAHPTQKPAPLMRWCLGFAPAAQTILDPFMGSGTTLRAAKDLGRKAIGIEIEEKYCEIAARRLQQEVLDLKGGEER